MNDIAQISCKISTSDPSAHLGFEIILDNEVIFNTEHVQETINFTYDLNDNDGEHLLNFIMKNKTTADTTVDAEGNIIKDARLVISDLTVDGNQIDQIFIDQAVYVHNFNGTGENTIDKFYGEMGCNGSVNIEFNTPIHLWLLENM